MRYFGTARWLYFALAYRSATNQPRRSCRAQIRSMNKNRKPLILQISYPVKLEVNLD